MPPTENRLVENVASTPVTPLKVGKFRASFIIAKESWAILRHDKEVLWFPFLSVLATVLAVVLFFFSTDGESIISGNDWSNERMTSVQYTSLFVLYLTCFFIINFFQSCIFIVVHGRMNGLNLSFSEGINGAMRVVNSIFLWSLISATVGILLQIIADYSKSIGKIIAVTLGGAWNILTYFSLLSLVIGGFSLTDSFKESAKTIRRTWGETLVLNIGVNLFFTFLCFLVIVLGIGLVSLVPLKGIIIFSFVAMSVSILILIVISSALGAIFKLALYEYARTGNIPNGFSPEIIQNAVKK